MLAKIDKVKLLSILFTILMAINEIGGIISGEGHTFSFLNFNQTNECITKETDKTDTDFDILEKVVKDGAVDIFLRDYINKDG